MTHYTSIATSIVGDATRVFNSVRGLTGFFRTLRDRKPLNTLQKVERDVQGVLGAATTARTAVTSRAALVTRLASFL